MLGRGFGEGYTEYTEDGTEGHGGIVGLRSSDTTRAIIGAAIEVHRALGPGLLESAYRRCLLHELQLRSFSVKEEVPLHLNYKGINVSNAYRMDLVVSDAVLVELKATSGSTPVHEAQLLTYLRLSGLRTGLLINFNVTKLTDGVLRRVL